MMRNPTLDNAKGILILLVFIGHAIEYGNGWQNDLSRYILTIIYIFHMPAFCFLAGMTTSESNIRRRVIHLSSILLTFQIIYAVATYTIGWPINTFFHQPIYILWFLLSLIFWSIALPYLIKIPYTLIYLFVFSLVCGAFNSIGYEFSASRTIYFMPFFVAGHLYGARCLEYIEKINKGRVKKGSILVLTLLPLMIFSLNINNQWFYGVSSYEKLGFNFFPGIILRATLTFSSAICTFYFLMLINDKQGLVNKIGRASLSVYLLHGIIILLGLGALFQRINKHFGVITLVVLSVIICFMITIMLSNHRVTSAINKSANFVSEKIITIKNAIFT